MEPTYRMCLGPTSPHFTLEPGTVRLVMSVKDHWNSRAVQQDDNDVCIDFEIQGYHVPDGSQDGHNEVISVDVSLEATYNFVPMPMTIEEAPN